MSKKSVLLMVIISCLALAVNVQGFESRDSGEFPYKFEMDVDPTAQGLGFSWYSTGTTKSIIDGVADFNSLVFGGRTGYWHDMSGGGAFYNGDFSNGLTYEIRIKIVKADAKGFATVIGTPGGDASLFIEESVIFSDYAPGHHPDSTASGDNTDDFHIFRLVMDVVDGNTSVYKDNELLIFQTITSSSPGEQLIYFGSGNEGSFDSHCKIDYVRWTEGMYAPPVTAHNPTPADTATDVSTYISPTWLAGSETDATGGHDVYFGTSFTDVNDATTATAAIFMGNQTGLSFDTTDYDVAGLTRLTNYYWRVDEVNATDPNVWKGKTWSFTTTNIDPYQAQILTPGDATERVNRNVTLSWGPGIEVAAVDGHEVYLGTSFSDVNDATTASAQYMGVQSSNSFDVNNYDAAGLRLETDYYWRVDEVNTLHGGSPWPGNVWVFTTRDRRISSTALSATASDNSADQKPASAVNGDGLSENGDYLEHSTAANKMWITRDVDTEPNGYSNPNPGTVTGPAWFRVELDDIYNLDEMWSWGYSGHLIENTNSMKNVTIQYSTTGGSNTSEWTELGDFKFGAGSGRHGYRHDTEVDFQGVAVKYIVITANDVNGSWKMVLTPENRYGLSELAFFESSDYALRLEPEDKAVDSSILTTTLEWTSGDKASDVNGQDVYFGTSFSDVNAASTASAEYQGRQTDTTFDPGILRYNTTYYWRIDEVNLSDGNSPWESNIWSFTTEVSLGGANAHQFNPDNKASFVNPELVTELSWMPGSDANEHDVYFGTNFTEVDSATTATATIYRGRQSTLSYTGIGTLTYANYFWRIDEVNDASGVLKGSTIKFSIALPGNSIDSSGITATCSSPSSIGRTPAMLLGPGLSEGLLHNTNPYDQWTPEIGDVNGYDNPNPGTTPGSVWLRFDLGKVYTLGELRVWNYNFSDAHIARGLRKVTIQYSTTGGSDSSEWTELPGDHEFDKAPAPVSASYAGFRGADFENALARYVVITPNDVDGNWGYFDSGNYVYALAEVLFFGPTKFASSPSPADTAIAVLNGTSLVWAAGQLVDDVNGHQVYFGTSFTDVNDATTASAVYMGAQSGTSYVPAEIIDKTYYWRVDEVNVTDANVWKGDVWSLTGYAPNAWDPRPATQTTGWGKWLKWSPGGVAADTDGHDVYVGTSFNDVYTANTGSSEYKGRQTDTYYCTGFLNDGNGLAHGETFYWRIDGVTAGGTAYQGDVWSFLNKRRVLTAGDGDVIWAILPPTTVVNRTYEEVLEAKNMTYDAIVQKMIDDTLTGIGDDQIDTLQWGEGGNTSVAEYNSVVQGRMGELVDQINPFVTKMIENGDDLPIIMIEESHKRGVEIFYTVRLNDIHDASKVRYISSFKNDNPGSILLWDYTDDFYGVATTLLFEQQIVRDFKADAIEELFELYDFDGVQIDFMRHLPHFTPGTEEANAHYMTDFMNDVRTRLNAVGQARGRKVEIAIKLPDSNESCTLNGLDVTTWVEDGLVDQVQPAGNGSMDVNVTDFLSMTAGTDVLVYPCIYSPYGFTVYPADVAINTSRAIATNHWYQSGNDGDGISVFNWYPTQFFGYPLLLNEVGDPDILVGLDKMYTVEQEDPPATRYYPFIKLGATLPQLLNTSDINDFPILVGEDIDAVYTPTDVTVELETDILDGDTLIIKLNGTTLNGPVIVSGNVSISGVDASLVSTGWNNINVECTAGEFIVSEIKLHVDYDVVPDFNKPTPNPMSFASAPVATGPATITMTADTATDAEAGVEYYFECTAGGGNDSGWQSSPVYTDTFLTPSTEYSYRVKARDTSVNNNETLFSGPASATTDVPNIADLDQDGQVNGVDFAIFGLAFGSTNLDPNWNPACDLATPANLIDELDLKVLTDNWLAGN